MIGCNAAAPAPRLLLPALHERLDEISHSTFRTSAGRKTAFAGKLLAMLQLRPRHPGVLADGAGTALGSRRKGAAIFGKGAAALAHSAKRAATIFVVSRVMWVIPCPLPSATIFAGPPRDGNQSPAAVLHAGDVKLQKGAPLLHGLVISR